MNKILQSAIQEELNHFFNTRYPGDIRSMKEEIFDSLYRISGCIKQYLGLEPVHYTFVDLLEEIPDDPRLIQSMFLSTREMNNRRMDKVHEKLSEYGDFDNEELKEKLSNEITKADLEVERFRERQIERLLEQLDECIEAHRKVKADGVSLARIMQNRYGDTLSSSQLADFFNVSTRTVSNWEKCGHLNNITATTGELKSNGIPKRGRNKCFLVKEIADEVFFQQRFAELKKNP